MASPAVGSDHLECRDDPSDERREVSYGVIFTGSADRLDNLATGLIHATKIGVYAGSGSHRHHRRQCRYDRGTGSAGYGIKLGGGGTVINSGTISGGSGTAISFGGLGGNLLVLENGYSIAGAITVAGTANTLELLGTAGVVTVDFDKSGAGFTSFGTVAFRGGERQTTDSEDHQ